MLAIKSIYIRQQLTAFRSGKRKHPEMKIMAQDLTDREIGQLFVYFSMLFRREISLVESAAIDRRSPFTAARDPADNYPWRSEANTTAR